jgi:hypothetical protein
MTMHDKRKLKRVHLIYYLRLFDNESGNHLGHLVDITTQGIMMISEEPVPIGKDYSFRMLLPGNITGREEINFGARCLWCRKDFNPDFYVSGFQIEDISPREVKTVTALINNYGFKSM